MIGLVSINEDRNYGAVLQAVGIQSFLTEIGIDSKFVCINREYNTVLNCSFHSPKQWLKSLFTFMHYKSLKNGCDRFQSFIDKNQKLFPKYNNYDELTKNPPNVKGYIVGSDQVWPEANLTSFYSLAFADKNNVKISYAASMGKDIIAQCNKEIYRNYLREFDAVSVREKSAIDAISEVYDGEISYHVDPTLLHDDMVWQKYEHEYDGKLPLKYILLYMIYVPSDVNKQLNQIRDYTELPIVMVSNTPYKRIKCDYYIRDAGPAEFLWLIHHAQGIISSSYHGVVFSIIYRKPFLAINNPKNGVRINNLLDLFDLQERSGWDKAFLEFEYDVDYIDKVLEIEKNRSCKYIKDKLL